MFWVPVKNNESELKIKPKTEVKKDHTKRKTFSEIIFRFLMEKIDVLCQREAFFFQKKGFVC